MKSIRIDWDFKDSSNAILYDGRSLNTLEDTIKLSYEPEEFRALLQRAGGKRTTTIKAIRRLYRGVKKE